MEFKHNFGFRNLPEVTKLRKPEKTIAHFIQTFEKGWARKEGVGMLVNLGK